MGEKVNDNALMKGKTVLITGATSGIGKETALCLAAKGARVVCINRNKEKSEELLRHLYAVCPSAQHEYLIADLSSLKQVRQAAEEFLSRHSRLDVLINNAGGYFNPRRQTEEGYEYTFTVNYLSHFLLTLLLLDLLKQSAPARIVHVSSIAYLVGGKAFDDVMTEKSYCPMKVYGRSKLANLVFSTHLARKLRGTRVVSNALHPGVVNTNFSKESQGLTGRLFAAFGFLFKSPEKGARTSVYFASSPEVEGITGKFFAGKKIFPTLPWVTDPQLGEHLWQLSTGFVKPYLPAF